MVANVPTEVTFRFSWHWMWPPLWATVDANVNGMDFRITVRGWNKRKMRAHGMSYMKSTIESYANHQAASGKGDTVVALNRYAGYFDGK